MALPAHRRTSQSGLRIAVIVLVGAALVGAVVAGLAATGSSRSSGVPTTLRPPGGFVHPARSLLDAPL